MLGAVAGDIIGSIYEHRPIKVEDFPLFQYHSSFTDDTVMSLAVAQAILSGKEYAGVMKKLGRLYPDAGYGGSFLGWIYEDEVIPYQSWGNGSAMRVAPIGFAFDTEEEVLWEAKASAEVSHNHPEGIKGAQAVALAIFLARKGTSKTEIRARISSIFCYNLDRTVEGVRPDYRFDVSCQGTVPEAIIAFLDSSDYIDSIRKAVSLGGDSDTLACITGGIAEAFYKKIPATVQVEIEDRLPDDLWTILQHFEERYPCCDLGS